MEFQTKEKYTVDDITELIAAQTGLSNLSYKMMRQKIRANVVEFVHVVFGERVKTIDRDDLLDYLPFIESENLFSFKDPMYLSCLFETLDVLNEYVKIKTLSPKEINKIYEDKKHFIGMMLNNSNYPVEVQPQYREEDGEYFLSFTFCTKSPLRVYEFHQPLRQVEEMKWYKPYEIRNFRENATPYQHNTKYDFSNDRIENVGRYRKKAAMLSLMVMIMRLYKFWGSVRTTAQSYDFRHIDLVEDED